MRANSISRLPNPRGRQFGYEPKWDGWRCVAHVTHDRVMLQSRQGRDLTRYFPDIVQQLQTHLPPGVMVDGELIVWDRERGRTSFTALQRRVVAGRGLDRQAAENPAHFVVFDLLADADGRPLADQPLRRRRARLERLFAECPPALQLCPQTRDAAEARRWLAEWADAGVEGLVIKDLGQAYTPGKAGWFKLKTRTTTEAIIGGATGSATDPGILLLGRFGVDGRFRYVAQSHPVPAARRLELAGLLAPLADRGLPVGHPWPQPLPATWKGQLDDRQPLHYVPVPPVIVAEVEVDNAYDADHGRWRHRVRYLRVRADLSVDDVPRWRLGAGVGSTA
ncbi:MAG TPA: ATP-dependent DNA ligase [Micromonosporaceae bacterium]|nr:ATP-dependent DNA ligase [Micromonosporaceae bacterium]